jgi:hypothetical protein
MRIKDVSVSSLGTQIVAHLFGKRSEGEQIRYSLLPGQSRRWDIVAAKLKQEKSIQGEFCGIDLNYYTGGLLEVQISYANSLDLSGKRQGLT